MPRAAGRTFELLLPQSHLTQVRRPRRQSESCPFLFAPLPRARWEKPSFRGLKHTACRRKTSSPTVANPRSVIGFNLGGVFGPHGRLWLAAGADAAELNLFGKLDEDGLPKIAMRHDPRHDASGPHNSIKSF